MPIFALIYPLELEITIVNVIYKNKKSNVN